MNFSYITPPDVTIFHWRSSWKPFLDLWTRENLKPSKKSPSFHVCIHRRIFFWKKICTQSHSTNFANWHDHVISIPDLAARNPTPRHSSGQSFSTFGNDMIRELPNHGANFGSLDARLVFLKFMHDMYSRVESSQPCYVTKTYWYEKLWTLSLLVGWTVCRKRETCIWYLFAWTK